MALLLMREGIVQAMLLTRYIFLLHAIDGNSTPPCKKMDSEAPSRVCVIDFGTPKVICDQLVKPPSTITDYVSHLVSLQVICLSRTHPQSQIFCNNSRSARPRDNDAAACTDEVFDELAGSLTRSDLVRVMNLLHPRCIVESM